LFHSLDHTDDPAAIRAAANDAYAMLDTHIRRVLELLCAACEPEPAEPELELICNLTWSMGGLYVLRDQLASIQSKAEAELERDAREEIERAKESIGSDTGRATAVS